MFLRNFIWISVPSQLEACLLPMGLTSENVAAAYGIPRDRQDIMAADSHKKVGCGEQKQRTQHAHCVGREVDGRCLVISLIEDG